VTDEELNGAPLTMSDQDYPVLFREADIASVSAQRQYFVLQRMYLGSLIVGGILAALTSLVWMYAVMAIVLTVGLLVLWISRSRQDDKAWFDCRAVAESVKTAAWRFMMIAPPFENDDALDQRFVSELQEIRGARPDCQERLAGVATANAPAITDFMRQMRARTFDERKRFYVEQRLRDQRSWYARAAQMNACSGERWFWTTAALQVIAIAVAIIQVATGGFGINMVPVITTCAASAAAWNQMKRHDELKKMYALASQELGELEAIAHGLNVEDDFPQLVEQVEGAISREHTMWCARRDVLIHRNDSDTQQRKAR